MTSNLLSPDATNSIPPATTGPLPSIEPPRVLRPLSVVCSWVVSKSHKTAPVSLLYARSRPSSPPANTTPGMTVGFAENAGEQPLGLPVQVWRGSERQTSLPSVRRSAINAPDSTLRSRRSTPLPFSFRR
jgi:hypothetical protein